MSQRTAPSTEVTNHAVYHALTSPYPRSRYPVGHGAALLASLSLLPDNVQDYGMRVRFRRLPAQLQALLAAEQRPAAPTS